MSPVAAARSIGILNCSAFIFSAFAGGDPTAPSTASLGGVGVLQAKAGDKRLPRFRHSQIRTHFPATGAPRRQVSLRCRSFDSDPTMAMRQIVVF
jgi:hypothetical protein